MGSDGLVILVSANQDRHGAGIASRQLLAPGINLSCYGTLDCKVCPLACAVVIPMRWKRYA